jgi:hypothetical protein
VERSEASESLSERSERAIEWSVAKRGDHVVERSEIDHRVTVRSWGDGSSERSERVE